MAGHLLPLGAGLEGGPLWTPVPAVAIALSRPPAPSRPWAWPCQVKTRQAEVRIRDREGLAHPLASIRWLQSPALRLQVLGKKRFRVVEPHSLHLRRSEDGASRLGPLNLEASRSALQAQIPLPSLV